MFYLAYHISHKSAIMLSISVVTVIETSTETSFFCKTEPNWNRGFMPLYWQFRFEMEQLWCLQR